MKIKRTRLAEIVAEEVQLRIISLIEDEAKGKKRGAETADAEQEPTRKQKDPGPSGAKPAGKQPEQPDATLGVDELDDQPETDAGEPELGSDSDSDGRDDAEQVDDGAKPTGAVNDALSGQTIQAITVEPKSKLLPGCKEIIITTNETTDPLRIIVSSSGAVKFWYRNALHDLP